MSCNNRIYTIYFLFKQDDPDDNIHCRQNGGEYSYSGTMKSIWFLWYHMVREREDILHCIVSDSFGTIFDPSLGMPLRTNKEE